MSYELGDQWRQQEAAPNNAEEIVAELQALEHERGGIMPKDVVELARDPESPLHGHFEWDDTLAADQHRLAQARMLIGSVRVKLEEAPYRSPMRAFVHLDKPHPHYESAHLAMRNEEKREMILSRAMSELGSFRRRYAELTELAGIFEAIEAQLKGGPGIRGQ